MNISEQAFSCGECVWTLVVPGGGHALAGNRCPQCDSDEVWVRTSGPSNPETGAGPWVTHTRVDRSFIKQFVEDVSTSS